MKTYITGKPGEEVLYLEVKDIEIDIQKQLLSTYGDENDPQLTKCVKQKIPYFIAFSQQEGAFIQGKSTVNKNELESINASSNHPFIKKINNKKKALSIIKGKKSATITALNSVKKEENNVIVNVLAFIISIHTEDTNIIDKVIN